MSRGDERFTISPEGVERRGIPALCQPLQAASTKYPDQLAPLPGVLIRPVVVLRCMLPGAALLRSCMLEGVEPGSVLWPGSEEGACAAKTPAARIAAPEIFQNVIINDPPLCRLTHRGGCFRLFRNRAKQSGTGETLQSDDQRSCVRPGSG